MHLLLKSTLTLLVAHINPSSVPTAHPTKAVPTVQEEEHSVTGVPKPTHVMRKEIPLDALSVIRVPLPLQLRQRRSVSISKIVRAVPIVRGSVTGALKIMGRVMPRDRGVDVRLGQIALRLIGVSDWNPSECLVVGHFQVLHFRELVRCLLRCWR